MMTNEQLNEKVLKIKRLEADIKVLQDQIDSIKEEIKQEMTLNNVDTFETGLFVITYKDVVSNRFDTKAFKKDNASIYESYCKQTTSQRFLIK